VTYVARIRRKKGPALRLVRGGRGEIPLGPLLVTLAPPDVPIAAIVLEEDTWLVLSAEPAVKPPVDGMVRIMTELLTAEPKTPGSVMVEGGDPLRILAIVYDLAGEPICRPEWVGGALQRIFAVAEEKGLSALALPLLGVRHGRLPVARFVELLAEAVRKTPLRRLRRVWLMATEQERRELRRLLAPL
jgi:hypothetical protein